MCDVKEKRELLTPAAQKDFDRIVAAAWAEYARIGAPASAEYDLALADYNQRVKTAQEKYDRIAKAAWAKHNKVITEAFMDLFDLVENRNPKEGGDMPELVDEGWQELSKKMAEWVRWRELKRADIGWKDTEGELHFVNFTQSLDACFKWLVPELEDFQGLYLNPLRNGTYEARLHFYTAVVLRAVAENPALALCLAIEKLVDSDKGGN